MGSPSRITVNRMSWRDICRTETYRGRWLALDNVRYIPGQAKPAEADVVDADEDLAKLCARMRAAERTSCAIVLCEEDETPAPLSTRRWTPPPPRALHR